MNGTLIGQASLQIKYLAFDSRKSFSQSDTLFVALKSKSNDGHNYIEALVAKGHQLFLVQDNFDCKPYPMATFIKVKHTLTALQVLTEKHRAQFALPTIAITGSNGKTIVKEWIYHLLKDNFNICKNPASFNSKIGVPLSVWQLNSKHNLALFEAGISEKGEMETLEKIIKPSIGIFTNLGDAHSNGFENDIEKLDEKFKLFQNCKLVIGNLNQEEVAAKITNRNNFSWAFGENENAKLNVISVVNDALNKTSTLKCKITKNNFTFELPFTDKVSIENALTSICTCCALNVDIATIIPRLKSLPKLDLRLQMQPALNNSILINDSYSNDYLSFVNAIDFLNEQAQNREKVLILSDFSGKTDIALALNTFKNAVKNAGIKKVLFVGELLNATRLENLSISSFNSTDELIENLVEHNLDNKAILIKGSRIFKFEKIVNALALKNHQSKLYIDLNALQDNLNQLKSRLLPTTKIMVMVKSFAYGTGSNEIAKLLSYNNIDYLAVAFADEGIELRKNGIQLPIMVMNHNLYQWKQLVEYNLEPQIYTLDHLSEWLQNYAKKYHLKLNTGMNRLGINTNDVSKVISTIEKFESCLPESILSHLAESENINDPHFTESQIAKFKATTDLIEAHFKTKICKHILNSKGIKNYIDAQFDMVRVGIGIYGKQVFSNFKNVLSLKSYITQIRTVKKGETVGYGRNYEAQRDIKIAIIGIGYADGLNRLLSNKGKVFVQNKFANIVGTICMDMTMINIDAIDDINLNDEVEIFGDHISIDSIAELCHTIPYEIMTNISSRVKRVYLKE